MLWWNRWRRKLYHQKLATTQPGLKSHLAKSIVYLTCLLILHSVTMVLFERMTVADAAWLTLTTVTTVGYGDLSAKTEIGRIATILLLYFGGIFLLGKTAGDYFDYRADHRRRKRCGKWHWNMIGHIVILNAPAHSAEQYFQRLLHQFRISRPFRHHPVQILSNDFQAGLPDSLIQQGGITHFVGSSHAIADLQAVNITKASIIIVLAHDEFEQQSDGRTFDILHRLGELQVQGTILAECVDDHNRRRLLNAGAHQVIRPIRAYPEMVVRALVAPGSETIIENFFTSKDDEYRQYSVNIDNLPWKEVVYRLLEKDFGTAIAYRDTDSGELVCHPASKETIRASELFLIVDENNIFASVQDIATALQEP